MSNKAVLLQTRSLSVGYEKPQKQVLLENLHLALPAGSLVCFMGPNGIGKSTLLRTLAGLQKPLSGEVILSAEKPGPTETFVSVVLTDRTPALYLTAEEVIAFGRYPYLNWLAQLSAHDRNVIEQAIATTHVAAFRHRKMFELSDGQIQLTMIARALAQETPVMLLDEPTAHLDLNNRVEIMNMLREIARQQGKAVLVATHELDLALQTADLIWLAGEQRNVLTGFPEDLVLNGVFDTIFRFKGFDLKTGKIQHNPWRNVPVTLTGEGAEYLWTKNALERNGYGVQAESSILVEVKRSHELMWLVNGQACHSLEEVITVLNRNSC
ncbi:MAG: iron(III) ABC transporter ATP-binding protein [Cyclobacteriaceae bacterium]|nr:MAG: iron(III) ABC transporter ATP-binding protein [Cyclobacteriaceae bacterium]